MRPRCLHQTTLPSSSQTSMAPQEDDVALMRRIAAQDQQAFAILYTRYAPRLTAFLTRWLHEPARVDEVLHDVMLALWQHAARFDPTRRLSTWLLGIARHKALSALRATKQPPELPPAAPAGSDQADPAVRMRHQERSNAIARAIAHLPPEQRLVVEWTYYRDCSPQEIAAYTDVSVHTVRSRLRLAHRRLSFALGELRGTQASNQSGPKESSGSTRDLANGRDSSSPCDFDHTSDQVSRTVEITG